MNNSKNIWSNLSLQVFIFLVVQIILAFYLGNAFWNPGSYVYTFGGDGSFIYYNMIFHTFHGGGMMLESMNYPHFESIFMTDAQASLSILFSWINDFFPDYFTPNKVVGWSHRIHYIMFGFAAIYMFKTLNLLDVNKLIAIIGSILIILLNPLMIRLQAGHFGLAYPFVFAFCLHFIVKLILISKIRISDFIILTIVLLFFGLNNFYISMINITFLLIVGFSLLLWKDQRKKATLLISQVILTISFLYAFISLTDIGADRIEIQWGYFTNSVNSQSFFYPITSIVYNTIKPLIDPANTNGETWVNLGIAPILALSILPLFYFLQGKKNIDQHKKVLFISFLISSLVLLLYASAYFYRFDFLKENVFHKISFATMFKASGRFSIPIYFMAGVTSLYAMDKILKYNIGKIVISILLILWCIETHQYLDKFVFTQMYNNPYNFDKAQLIKKEKIDLSNYQAIYTLPVMEGWNDKIHITPNFQAEFNSILYSMSTGLPMINGMLSRIGISDAMKAIQLSSNPMIQKELIIDLQKSKPILIIYGKSHINLTEGENFILNNSEIIYDANDYQLRSMLPKRFLSNSTLDSLDRNEVASFYIYENFNELKTDLTFDGNGSLEIFEDSQIFKSNLPDSILTEVEVSLYVHIDNKMYGMPSFEVVLRNSSNNIILTTVINSTQPKDNYINWIRASEIISIPTGAKTIEINAININQKFLIDEILIKSMDGNLFMGNLVNNFKLAE